MFSSDVGIYLLTPPPPLREPPPVLYERLPELTLLETVLLLVEPALNDLCTVPVPVLLYKLLPDVLYMDTLLLAEPFPDLLTLKLPLLARTVNGLRNSDADSCLR